VAALCRLYGLGRPQWNVNVFPHCHFASTSCPGQIYGSQRDAYISCAQLWYDRMGAGDTAAASPAPDASSADVDIDALAREVIAGRFGNGDDRRRAARG
jgi:N-acetylmuramoyl-L-alanine amidase